MKQADLLHRRDTEMMHQIAALPGVPPTERFDFETERDQGGLDLFNLNLHSAMRQREGQRTVEKNFHDAEIWVRPTRSRCPMAGNLSAKESERAKSGNIQPQMNIDETQIEAGGLNNQVTKTPS